MTQSQTTAIVAVAVVAVAAIGGGLAYAAKDAEPGDMLYSLRASLYSDVDGGEAQSDLDAAREAYREAADLQARGQLTAGEQARINATYSMRVNAVVDRIAELEAEGNLEAAASLRTELRAMLREANDLFPGATGDASSSSESSITASGSSLDDDSSSSSMQGGQSSSIFVQPSSSVTSA